VEPAVDNKIGDRIRLGCHVLPFGDVREGGEVGFARREPRPCPPIRARRRDNPSR
jgi:hypothetical protein